MIALLAQVALPIPLSKTFTYRVPAHLAETILPGMRVICRFRGRALIGVVLEVARTKAPEGMRLLPIGEVIDEIPSVPPELLLFLQQLAAYYLAPIGEVLRTALPALERRHANNLRQRGLLDTRGKEVGGRFVQVASATSACSDGVRLRGATPLVLAYLRANGPTEVARLCDVFSTARAAVKRLAALGLVSIDVREQASDPFFVHRVARDTPPEPTAAQQEAISAINGAIDKGSGRAFLLHGVTGSGKTEVYLHAIDSCLRAGRGALVLVPEIALTPQLVSRFRARFGDDVAVLHSGLSDRARHEMWKALRHDL
ncbi:MAG: primosomal protein N', partial [Sorangium cellulosum]